jgi:hypothetical protein
MTARSSIGEVSLVSGRSPIMECGLPTFEATNRGCSHPRRPDRRQGALI